MSSSDDSAPSPPKDDGSSSSDGGGSSPPPTSSSKSPPPPAEKGDSPSPSPPPPPSSSSPPPQKSPAPSPPRPSSSNSPPPKSTTSPPPPPPPPSPSPPPPTKSSTPSSGSSRSPPPPESAAPPPPSQSSGSENSPPSNDSPFNDAPPPPEAVSSHSPPSSTHSASLSPPSTGSSSSKSGSGTNSSAIIGATVGAVILICLIALLFLLLRRRRRRTQVYAGHYIPQTNNYSTPSGGYNYHGQSYGVGQSGQSYGMGHSGQSYGMGHSGPDGFSGQGPNSSVWGSQRGIAYNGGAQDSGFMGGSKTFFSYEELMEITNGFSRQNLLGEGGFGCVYKGVLSDGRVVAVKQLKAGSGQGEREFRAEVEIISRVHHRHLVSLVGFCIAENQRLLIYEFVPNNTLEHHLHGKGMPVLEWSKRLKIALGSAKGLAYLHEDCHPKIIHRDIKSANILLDDAFEAQVADFGLAKPNNDANTHVSTRVMGTFGYLAPEYASSGKLTDRSDVFSFGVMLLELITGRKPVDSTRPLGEESLVEWARPHLFHAIETGELDPLVDPRLEKQYVESEMFRMVEAAAASVRHSAQKRPRMVQVVRALDTQDEMSDLSNGVKYGQSTMFDSGQYNQDISKFRRMALGSCDGSEYDMYSGEHNRMSRNGSSSESETRAINSRSTEQRYGGAGTHNNYGSRLL